ncbi:MAG: DUF6498-containing protein [Ignavibacteriales bacterium]|nr:DUF6498-containing protein [Ignavibacteriales bacterium]
MTMTWIGQDRLGDFLEPQNIGRTVLREHDGFHSNLQEDETSHRGTRPSAPGLYPKLNPAFLRARTMSESATAERRSSCKDAASSIWPGRGRHWQERPPAGPAMSERSKIGLTGLWKNVDLTRFSTLSLLESLGRPVRRHRQALRGRPRDLLVPERHHRDLQCRRDPVAQGVFDGGIPARRQAGLADEGRKISDRRLLPVPLRDLSSVYGLPRRLFRTSRPGSRRTGRGLHLLLRRDLPGAVSRRFHHVEEDERREIPDLGRTMFAPYVRIVPMHLTIILSVHRHRRLFSAGADLAVLAGFLHGHQDRGRPHH